MKMYFLIVVILLLLILLMKNSEYFDSYPEIITSSHKNLLNKFDTQYFEMESDNNIFENISKNSIPLKNAGNNGIVLEEIPYPTENMTYHEYRKIPYKIANSWGNVQFDIDFNNKHKGELEQSPLMKNIPLS